MDGIRDVENVHSPANRLRRMADKTQALEVDHSIRAHMYFKSGMEMIRLADMYQKDGRLGEAYTLYLKFITLFVEKIRDHPEWASLPNHDKKIVSNKLKEAIPKAEKLKELLRQQFELEYQQRVAIALEQEKQRRKAAEEEARRQEQERQRQLELKQHGKAEIRNSDFSNSDVVTGPTFSLDSIVYPDSDYSNRSNQPMLQPSAPYTDVPLQPSTTPSYDNNLRNDGSRLLPSVDRSTKPASLISLTTQSHLGLRNVVVPSQLVERFLVLAHGSTIQNIETCGILVGHLDQNQLVISHLILPKQTATPDSCTTENEEEVFMYQDKHNLITLGWIHTHPSQTAFLSSVDLHTHCSYQLMMPEAIAIVCAPRYKDNSIFCLTQNYGLDFIAKCNKSGFHPHPAEPPLFVIAEHARLESDLPVEVVDMRR